jgi:integrase
MQSKRDRRKALTDTLLRSVRPPLAGRIELADLRCKGLEFRITAKKSAEPSSAGEGDNRSNSGGVASWSFRFRDPQSGKPNRFTIGPYPEISLANARQRADDLRKQVAAGENPVIHKRQERADAATKTFNVLADRYLTRYARALDSAGNPRKRSADADERNLKLHVLPKWGKRRYDTICRADVIELIDGLIDAGKPVLANRVQSLISKVFSFALDEVVDGRPMIAAHPCARLKKKGTEQVGRRVLSDDEIRLFWTNIVKAPVSLSVGLALRLALLTGTRASEVAGIARSELHQLNDRMKATWIIPGTRTKNGRDHLIPLAKLARDAIADAMEAATEHPYLFPRPQRGRNKARKRDEQHPQNPVVPVRGHSLAVAMQRFAAEITGKDKAIETWRADPPTPHDLRRTFQTRMSSLGVPKEDRDALMNHVRSDVGSKHYDLYDRVVEKRRALERWSTALSSILVERAGVYNAHAKSPSEGPLQKMSVTNEI